MSPLFRLYWLRENGCDTGTPLRVAELEPAIQSRVRELASNSAEVLLKLPYMDLKEWRKRDEILAGLRFERHGQEIVPFLGPRHAIRNAAANLALGHSAWKNAPAGSDLCHFPVWRGVSVRLQRCFREWIAGEYFDDCSRFEDRESAYPMICYQAARLCHGRARNEFTYDFRDYPECRQTVNLALKTTGVALQVILANIEQRLNAEGMEALARRYRPVWYQDLMVAVKKQPKQFIALLAAESAFINALMELSHDKTPTGVHTFAKTANQALRKVYGMDWRHVGLRALEETTRILESAPGGRELLGS